jgi:hypothetical protein
MLFLLSFWACTSQDIKIAEYNTAPDVSILAPVDNQEFGWGEMVTFQGQVGDMQDGPELLVLKWTSTLGNFAVDGIADADGGVLLSTDELELGTHTITLRAVDTEGEASQASIVLSVAEILEEPQIVIRSPDEGETLSHGVDIAFEADVFDSNDAPSELQVVFESSIDGIICLPTIQEETDVSGELIGQASCQAQLSAEYHQLTYTVTDTDGMSSSTTRYVLVESPDSDGDGFTSAQGDCDDTNASANPQASESPYVNGIDEDCDGIIDEGTEVYDDDGDGYTEQGGDCDDENASVNPDMDETCADDIDSNCDGILGDINGNAEFCTPFYLDADGDGQGLAGASMCMCEAGEMTQYSGYTSTNTLDCHDGNPDVFNGQTLYFKDPYTINGTTSFDYNCDSYEDIAGVIPQSSSLSELDGFFSYAECACDSSIDSDNDDQCDDIVFEFGLSSVLIIISPSSYVSELNSGCTLNNGTAGWMNTIPGCGESSEFLLDDDSCYSDVGLIGSWALGSQDYFCAPAPEIYYQGCN